MIASMDNQDVLRKLCILLDYTTLLKFGKNSMWTVSVLKLVKDPIFWKEKTEHLLGQELSPRPGRDWETWITVYLTMVRWKNGDYEYDDVGHKDDEDEDKGIFSHIYFLGMDNLDAMQTIVDIVPPRRLTLEDKALYRESMIRTAEVLDWLLENKYIEYDRPQFMIQLGDSSASNRLGIVRYIFDRLGNIHYDDVRQIIYSSAGIGARDTTLFLLKKYILSHYDTRVVLNGAIRGNNTPVVAYLLNTYGCERGYLIQRAESSILLQDFSLEIFTEILKHLNIDGSESQAESDRLFDLSIKYRQGQALQAMIDADPRLEKRVTFSLLYNEIMMNSLRIVPVLLKYVNPMEEGDRAIITSSNSSPAMFELLISDPRVPIMLIIDALVPKILYDAQSGVHTSLTHSRKNPERVEVMIQTLAENKRVDVAALKLSTLRSLLWGLGSLIEDKIEGYIAASALVGRRITRREMGESIERNTTRSILLRYILLKQPTNAELVQRMIEQKNRELIRAAANVVSDEIGRDMSIVALEALMLSMLYPTLNLRDLISDLRAEGVKREELASSASLVGAHMGKKAIE